MTTVGVVGELCGSRAAARAGAGLLSAILATDVGDLGSVRAPQPPPDLGPRIAVLGCAGAGKSWLAREIGRVLALPVIHLDAEFWRPGWVETPHAEWIDSQARLFEGNAWVADGNFHRTLAWRTARATSVVFLDLPRRTCLLGAIGRWLRHRGQVREDMAAGCPEKFDAGFLRWIWRFRRDVRPHMLEALAEYEARGGQVIVLHRRRDVNRLVAAVGERGSTDV